MKKNVMSLKILSPFFIFSFLVLGICCKKDAEKQKFPEMPPIAVSEIDIQKIESSIDLQFTILKAQTVGIMPRHRFYWVCLDKETSQQKIKDLAQAIFTGEISNNPKTYNSFLIHFFLKSELKETLESSESLAQATYLPNGSWLEIRKNTVENYDNYKLTCTFFD